MQVSERIGNIGLCAGSRRFACGWEGPGRWMISFRKNPIECGGLLTNG
jgi:hypothetical protein